MSRQLVALGHDPIGVFHHDAIRLPNGHTLALASVERFLTDVQGPGAVNVYGEMVVDLDENFQVVWAWKAFDTLDVTRAAILDETCTPAAPGCPTLFLAPVANDWLHANAIAHIPSDGNRKRDPRLRQRQHACGRTGWNRREQPRSGAHHRRCGADSDARAELRPRFVFARARLRSAAVKREPVLRQRLLGDPAHPLSQGVELSLDGATKFSVGASAFTYRVFRMKDLYRP